MADGKPSRLKSFFEAFSRRLNSYRPEEWEVLLVCLLLATVFWFFNALNKTYSARVSYPFQVLYDSTQVVPVAPPPNSIQIQLSGEGWELLKHFLSWRHPPLKYQPTNLPQGNYTSGYRLLPKLNDHLQHLKVDYVATDTIRFRFDSLVRRRIPLAVDTNSLRLAEGFRISSPIRIRPDTVLVKGAAHLVRQLPQPFPLPIATEQPVDAPLRQKISLQKKEKGRLLQFRADSAEVHFQVSRFVRQSVAVEIKKVHFPPSGDWALSENTVYVQFVRRETGNPKTQPQAENFEVWADYRLLNEKNEIPLALKEKPKGIYEVKIRPYAVKIRNADDE